jgi:hypothetical protein
MRRYPVSVIMAMLSLTNILILAGPVTMQWLNHKVFIGFVVTGSSFLCAFHVYIDLVGSSVNSWLVLMIAVERYLSVTKPFLIRTSFNRQQAWIIVLSVVLVALIAPLGLAIVASNVDGCRLFFSKTYQIIGSIQIFFIYVLPSILILTLSMITVHKLRNRIRTSGSRRIHISVMLITVSFAFITFTMPYQICWYWLFSTAIGSVELNLKVNIINIGFRYLALTIRNLNYTLNFFLYSLTSMVFLKEAFTIAHCNYFLNQSFIERYAAFRRLFSFNEQTQSQQTTNTLLNRDRINNGAHHHNYQSFCKHSCSNDPLINQQHSPTLFTEYNDQDRHGLVLTLKSMSIHSKQHKRSKWTLKPSQQIFSDDRQLQRSALTSNIERHPNDDQDRWTWFGMIIVSCLVIAVRWCPTEEQTCRLLVCFRYALERYTIKTHWSMDTRTLHLHSNEDHRLNRRFLHPFVDHCRISFERWCWTMHVNITLVCLRFLFSAFHRRCLEFIVQSIIERLTHADANSFDSVSYDDEGVDNVLKFSFFSIIIINQLKSPVCFFTYSFVIVDRVFVPYSSVNGELDLVACFPLLLGLVNVLCVQTTASPTTLTKICQEEMKKDRAFPCDCSFIHCRFISIHRDELRSTAMENLRV